MYGISIKPRRLHYSWLRGYTHFIIHLERSISIAENVTLISTSIEAASYCDSTDAITQICSNSGKSKWIKMFHAQSVCAHENRPCLRKCLGPLRISIADTALPLWLFVYAATCSNKEQIYNAACRTSHIKFPISYKGPSILFSIICTEKACTLCVGFVTTISYWRRGRILLIKWTNN